MELIYEARLLGAFARVFVDRVEYKPSLFSGIRIIPLSQIVSVKTGSWAVNNVTIELTSGGRVRIAIARKKEFTDAIYSAQSMATSPVVRHEFGLGVADEIVNLSKLRDDGVLSNDDLEHHKQILVGGGLNVAAPTRSGADSGRGYHIAAIRPRPSGRSSLLRGVKVFSATIGGLFFSLVVLSAIFGSKKQAESTSVTSQSTGNTAHDELQKLPMAEQAVRLGNMVEEGCVGKRAFYMGMDQERRATWSVGCANGTSYSVMIEPDNKGSTTVLDCRVMRATADIDCFATFDSQANRPPRTRKQFMCAISHLPPQVREQALRRFVENLEDYAGESGDRSPRKTEQTLKQFLQKLDKDYRGCDERKP